MCCVCVCECVCVLKLLHSHPFCFDFVRRQELSPHKQAVDPLRKVDRIGTEKLEHLVVMDARQEFLT